MKPILFFGKSIDVQPIAISIGNISIYWYGLLIAFAFISQLLFLKYRTKDKEKSYGISMDTLYDFAFGALLCGILGARIYYVLFSLDYYLENPFEIIALWNGGLAIYGGIIGSVLYAVYYSKKHNICFLDLADLVIPHLAFAQAIGRWGNFFNREAYGYETNIPWKMGIYSERSQSYIYVHPTFLYESLWNISLFFILMWLSSKRKYKGQILYAYFIGYGIGRAIIEGFRTDSLMFLNVRVSQIFSIIIVFVVIILAVKKNLAIKKKDNI